METNQSKAIQFTYAYTQRVYGSSFTQTLGWHVYNATRNSRAKIKADATGVISTIKQYLPRADDTAHGYTIYNKRSEDGDKTIPVFFRASNRPQSNMMYKGARSDEERYLLHVTMDVECPNGVYAIEFCNGSLKNTTERIIDDTKTPDAYNPLLAEDYETGKNVELSLTKVREKQVEHLKELALLAAALVEARQTNKKLFLCARPDDSGAILDWMAQLLMLFPASVANTFSFNTYMPDPTQQKFDLCGVIEDSAQSKENLATLGFVFEVGNSIRTEYRPSTNDDLYNVMSLCAKKKKLFKDWVSVIEKATTLEQFLFLTSVFRLTTDPEWDDRDKIYFINANYRNPSNTGGLLLKQVAEMLQNENVEGDKITANAANDCELAYLLVESLKNLASDPAVSSNDKALETCMQNILFFMLKNTETAHFVFETILQRKGSLEKFFGSSTDLLLDCLLKKDGAESVKEAVKTNFSLPYGVSINKNILVSLIRIYMREAAREEWARETMDLCVTTLFKQHSLVDLLKILDNSSDQDYVSVAKFLLEVKNDGNYLLERDELYRSKMFEHLTNSGKYDDVLFAYVNAPQINETVCGYLLLNKWTATGVSLATLLDIFENRSNYRATAMSVFEECYLEVFSLNIEEALRKETECLATLTSAELQARKREIDRVHLDFFSYNRNSEIRDLHRYLQHLLIRIDYYLQRTTREEHAKEQRVYFVSRKVHQLSYRAVRKLLEAYGIKVESEGKENFMASAEIAVKEFLQSQETSNEAKVAFCNALDEEIGKCRHSDAIVGSTKNVLLDLFIVLAIMGVFVTVVSLLGGVLFSSLAGGYSLLMYKVFPVFGLIFSGIMFYYNGNIAHRSKRIVFSTLEALGLVIVMMIVYHACLLLI